MEEFNKQIKLSHLQDLLKTTGWFSEPYQKNLDHLSHTIVSRNSEIEFLHRLLIYLNTITSKVLALKN
jgi:hypothetical protein